MAVRIGINPITWTNDDLPSLGGDTPVETCLAEAREAGFAGIEMGGKFPKTSRELAAAARAPRARSRVRLVRRAHPRARASMRSGSAILPHMTLLRDMGSEHVVYADTSGRSEGDLFAPISKRPEARRRRMGELRPAAHRRLPSAWPISASAWPSTTTWGRSSRPTQEVDRLMASTGQAVGLLYDTGHCLFSGGDPERSLERHVGSRRSCPLQGLPAATCSTRARASDESFMQAVLDGVFTVPGDGFVDYPHLARHPARRRLSRAGSSARRNRTRPKRIR